MKIRLMVAGLAGLLLASCGSKDAKVAETARAAASTEISVDNKTQRQVGIEVETVESRPVAAPISSTGELQMNEDRTWHAGAILAGRITAYSVHLGDRVTPGQVMAEMHSHEVHDARAARRQALADLDKANVQAGQAGRVQARTQRLFDLKAASREQVEAAETQYKSALIGITHAQASVTRAETHITEILEIPLEEPAAGKDPDDHADQVPIKAPAAGTVISRHANVGTAVTAGNPVVTISDLSSLWFIAAVNEADLSQIRPGQAVQISVRSYPNRTFVGKVGQLGEKLDAETRTLQVRVLVDNAGGLLKPQMFGTAEFTAAAPRTLVHVPESAIQEIAGKMVVFVRTAEGKFAQREVKPGARMGRQVEILSGLEPGMAVVTRGAVLLKSQLLKGEGE